MTVKVTSEEIDEYNIYQASREAMRRAVEGLGVCADHLLVDARTVPRVSIPQTPLKKGDQRSQSIAAASIVAKVYRDDLMEDYAHQYPGYGFEAHAGYPTAAHLDALSRLGPTLRDPSRRSLASGPGESRRSQKAWLARADRAGGNHRPGGSGFHLS